MQLVYLDPYQIVLTHKYLETRPPKRPWLFLHALSHEKSTKCQNSPPCNVKESRGKKIMIPFLYSEQHQNLMGSILSRDPSSNQISWRPVQ